MGEEGLAFGDLDFEDRQHEVEIPDEVDVFSINEIMEIVNEKGPDDTAHEYVADQVKASPGESDDERRSSIDMPSAGLESLDVSNHQPCNKDAASFQPHKEADLGLQGTVESDLYGLPNQSLDILNPGVGDSFQPYDACGTSESSQSEFFQGLEELGFMSPIDCERPQQGNGSVLASNWISLSLPEHNILTDVPAVSSLKTEREGNISGNYDGFSYPPNLKSHTNNISKSASEQSCQVPKINELVDLTQTDSSDDDMEITTGNFGGTSEYDGVDSNVRRKLPSWGQSSGKVSTMKESKEMPWRNSTHRETSDWNPRKAPINAQRRIVGLQFQGTSGAVSNGIFAENMSTTGFPYQDGEFRSETKPPVKEEWVGGASSSTWNPASMSLDVEVDQKPTMKDIPLWNYESDTEDVPESTTNIRRFLPPTVPLGSSWPKVDDERRTFRAVLQDLAQPLSETTPDDGLMAVPLLRHQKLALAWMVQKETNNMHCAGGILADDQGLGKTVSTVALILKERPAYQSAKEDTSKVKHELSAVNLDEDDVEAAEFDRKTTNHNPNDLTTKESTLSVKKGRPSAGTLVVCPTSVLRQWAQEIRDKVTAKAKLSVLIYHGSNRTKDPDEVAKYDVVLTTYSIVSMEVPKQEHGDDQEEAEKYLDGGLIDSFTEKKKKKSSEKAKKKNQKGANGSSSELSPRPLAKVAWFRVVLDEAQTIKNHRTQVARACWGLRAKRRWCLSGTPIQNSIDDLYSYFRFLKYDPYAVYRSFCSTIKLPISRNPVSGYKKLQAVLKTVMLRRTKGTLLDGEPIIKLPPKTVTLKKVEFSMEERNFYKKLEEDSRDQFKVYAAAGTVKQNYVNILLMLLRLRQACDHPRLVKSCSADNTWGSSAETARKLPLEKQIDLISRLEGSIAICGICNDAPEVAVVTLCGHVFCNQCISTHRTQNDDTICPSPNCKDHVKADSVFSLATLKNCISRDPLNDENMESLLKKTDSNFEDPELTSSKIKAALETLRALPKIRTGVPNRTDVDNTDKGGGSFCSMPDDFVQENASELSEEMNPDVQPSLKKQVVEMPEKAIVFSQWTSMLDLLEVPLQESCIQYRRLDGTMSVHARDKAVNDFKTLPEVTVMIMSLKAASLGLNMVAACHVLLLDLWWNPTTEDQAIDRAHRIGQTRPVHVSRFTVKDTVEDRILALQERKREMVASAFGEDPSGGRHSHLTEEDLRYLFMI
uniref:Helicase-like transcription factor CHR28 n=1 Tax=Araucaria cunninghamii TaxID=56994 RepID=A0A0D6QTY3_ARACU